VSGPAGPNDRTGIWTLAIVGGTVRKVRDDANEAVISPDGSQIAFLLGNEIWLMRENGEDARRLATADDGYSFERIDWSPDGQSIAGIKKNRGYGDVAIEKIDLQGGHVTTILSDSRMRDFCWVPDGRMIYGRLENSDETTENIWEVRLDPSTSHASQEPRRLTQWAGFTLRGLSATADGKQIGFVRKSDQSDVYVGSLVKGKSELSATHRLTLDDRMDWPGGWLRESNTILFFSDRDGQFDLFKQGIKDRASEEIIADPEDKRAPQLSPDGSWILYLAFANAQSGSPPTGRLMRIPVAGGTPEPVLRVSGYPGSARAPRERWLPSARGYPDFRCSSGMPAAHSCVLAEANPQEIMFSAFDPKLGRLGELAKVNIEPSDSFWDLSPDGSRIAFGKLENQSSHIRVLDLASGKTREISVKDWSNLTSVGWSADGQSLFAATWGSKGGSILRVSLNGKTQLMYKAVGMQLERPVPSPDGRYLAFAEVSTTSNAWMVENF
jgi:eukaryotic-like serine/threonine-protein kinase